MKTKPCVLRYAVHVHKNYMKFTGCVISYNGYGFMFLILYNELRILRMYNKKISQV